jgi:hypothetical protein
LIIGFSIIRCDGHFMCIKMNGYKDARTYRWICQYCWKLQIDTWAVPQLSQTSEPVNQLISNPGVCLLSNALGFANQSIESRSPNPLSIPCSTLANKGSDRSSFSAAIETLMVSKESNACEDIGTHVDVISIKSWMRRRIAHNRRDFSDDRSQISRIDDIGDTKASMRSKYNQAYRDLCQTALIRI